MEKKINCIYQKLLSYIKDNEFKGWDPYDILLSKPIRTKYKNRKVYLALTQLNRLSIINFRKLLQIKKNYNTKAMALILYSLLSDDYYKHYEIISFIKNWLIDFKSSRFNNYTIGFNFDIVLKSYTSPKKSPSLIISLFTMYSFLKLWEISKEEEILNILMSFQKLLQKEWPKYETSNTLWYSYNFDKLNEIYNATAKVGKFYANFYKIHGMSFVPKNIYKILNYLLKNQRKDGSWPYQPNSYTDGFHTAFILDAILDMREVVDSKNFECMFKKGLDNYKKNMFKDTKKPLYFHPIYKPEDIRRYFIETDIRDCAMAIKIFTKINDRKRAENTLKWTIENMYNKKKGYFYYYKNKIFINKIEYIRWQAWMLLALSDYKQKWSSSRLVGNGLINF